MSQIIQEIEKAESLKTDLPEMGVGDTVRVHQAIVEGKKKRVQRFEGLIIKIQNHANRELITLRRIIDSIGVEKSFLVHSPRVEKIELVKRGRVRRARLNYLRDRVGARATRVKAAD